MTTTADFTEKTLTAYKLSNILYNKVKVDELGLIKKYFEKISEEKVEFKEEELQKIIDKNVDKNKMIRISKFCRI